MRRNIERWRSAMSRLSREPTVWLATVRHDNRPHLVPVWFIWLDDKIYFATGQSTQKFTNLRFNQAVALSLPDTTNTIIIEGEAHAANRSTTNNLAEYFYNKYEWDFRYDESDKWMLVEVTPHKILVWGDGYDHEGIRLL